MLNVITARNGRPAQHQYFSSYAREKTKLGAVPSREELVDLGRMALRKNKSLAAVALFIDARELDMVEQALARVFRRGGRVPVDMKEVVLTAMYRLKRAQRGAW